jgi:membrane-bound serine protease (ClpP class)
MVVSLVYRCRRCTAWLASGILAILLLWPAGAAGQGARGPLYTAEAGGVITAPTVEYLRDAVRQAETANANALIITLSSSGGVLSEVRALAAELAAAKAPVVVFVTPSGTQSGAVGAYFLSAAGVAAMAPGTSFGSVYPLVQPDPARSQQAQNIVIDSQAQQLRSWNDAHGRSTEWIDRAVREGAVLNNEQASTLSPPAVDLVVTDLEQLLTLLDGRRVRLADGRSVTLQTLGRTPERLEPTLWQSLRMLVSDPTVAFALLVLGALAISLELAAPGTTIFLGVGLVLLAAAALGFVALPLHMWALALVVVGLALIGAEFLATAHGALALAGIALLIAGALNLVDTTQAPGVEVAPWMIGLIAAVLAIFAAFFVVLIVRTRTHPVQSGQDALIGQVAEVRRRLDPEGFVFVDGALWRAVSENGDAAEGELVRVVARHNLRLIVQRIDDDAPTMESGAPAPRRSSP